MKNTALRGTIIMLAAVALIGAVVALRVAQAQTRTYEISVTPDKVLEQDGGNVDIMVKVSASPAFDDDPMLYLYIANEEDGDGCDFAVANCANDANASDDSSDNSRDLIPRPDGPTNSPGAFEPTSKIVTFTFNVAPYADNMIEGDEKIYLALCAGAKTGTSGNRKCSGNNERPLTTASITIVGERVWVDNTANNNNTSTAALKGDTSAMEDQPVAASFTTGSDTNGYRMNNVKLKFWKSESEMQGGDPVDPAGVSVKLFRDNGSTPGAPGAFVSNLTRLDGVMDDPDPGVETIYVIQDGTLLDPNSTYWVQISGTAGSLETTGSHAQTGQNGWEIQDGFLVDSDESVEGEDWMADTARSLKMQISGIPRGNIVVEPAALSVEENLKSTYTVRLDSPPLTETVVNVKSEDRSITTISPESLTFGARNDCNIDGTLEPDKCWWKPQEVTVKGGFVIGEPVSMITHEASEGNVKKSGLPDVTLKVTEVVVVGPLLGSLDAENATSSATSTVAQPFRAGNSKYSLTHVQVEFEDDDNDLTNNYPGVNTTVKVCSRQGSGQNTEPNLGDCDTYTYEDNSAFDDIHTYQLVGGKEIGARENYYVVVSVGNGWAGKVRLTEETGGTSRHGWNLGDSHFTSTTTPNVWTEVTDAVAKVNLIGRSLDTASANATATALAQADATATAEAEANLTATAQAVADLTATAEANLTATAQAVADLTATAEVNLTATALAADPTAQANATATAQADATATAQANATATAQANATATALAGTPTATPVAGPGVAPSGLRVSARTQTTATISWIPGADAEGYVAIARIPGEPVNLWKTSGSLDGAARSYTFTGLRQRIYTYFVYALDASGDILRAPDGGFYSTSVVGSGPPALDVTPSGLSVVRSGSTAILTWTPGADATRQYVAAMITGDRSSLQLVGPLSATASSGAFTGLRQGVYTYHILAFDTYDNFSSPSGSLYYAWITE